MKHALPRQAGRESTQLPGSFLEKSGGTAASEVSFTIGHDTRPGRLLLRREAVAAAPSAAGHPPAPAPAAIEAPAAAKAANSPTCTIPEREMRSTQWQGAQCAHAKAALLPCNTYTET